MIVIYLIDMLNHWLINHQKIFIKKKLLNKYGVKKTFLINSYKHNRHTSPPKAGNPSGCSN